MITDLTTIFFAMMRARIRPEEAGPLVFGEEMWDIMGPRLKERIRKRQRRRKKI